MMGRASPNSKKYGLLVTVALLAAAASLTPAVAALQLASDGNVDASLEPGKDTALHLLLFGEPPAKKKVTKKRAECNFPFVKFKGDCNLPCYYKDRPAQAKCYRPKIGAKCPTGMYPSGSFYCRPKNMRCGKGEFIHTNYGCRRRCDDETGERNRACKTMKRGEPCPTNYEKDVIYRSWCINKVCPEGHRPSRKDGSCEKGCAPGGELVNGKCHYICPKGYQQTPDGGCKV